MGQPPPPPPPIETRNAFYIRGMLSSKCHVWVPTGLGSRLQGLEGSSSDLNPDSVERELHSGGRAGREGRAGNFRMLVGWRVLGALNPHLFRNRV